MVRRHARVAGALLALSGGCSKNVTEAATALYVVVEADPEVRSRGGVVNVTTRRPNGGAPVVLDRQTFMPGATGWPFSFVVQARDPSSGIEVVAEVVVNGADAPVAVARAVTVYRPRQTLVVPLMLWGGCTPARCRGEETCARPTVEGASAADACASAIVGPMALTPHSPTAEYGACPPMQYRYGAMCRALPMPSAADAGVADAGADATVSADVASATDAALDIATVADAGGDLGALDAAATDVSDAPAADRGSVTDAADCGGECPRGQFCVAGSCGAASSCREILRADPMATSGVQSLRSRSGEAYRAYCEMAADGGGWTLLLKASGTSPTFRYSSEQWTLAAPLAPGAPDVDVTEAKLLSFASLPFTDLRVVFRSPESAGSDHALLLRDWRYGRSTLLDWMRTPAGAGSLGVRRGEGSTSVRYARWIAAISSTAGGGSLSSSCMDEGFNLVGPSSPGGALAQSVRIGILGDDSSYVGTVVLGACASPDSRLGVGGEGVGCSLALTGALNAVGNVVAPCGVAPVGARDVRAFAWVMAR